MKTKFGKSSWIAFVLFYLVLILIVSMVDNVNGILTLPYWSVQVGLITIGVGIFGIVGLYFPNLTATASILLSFTIGVLTIIPALLMSLGDIPDFWPNYFSIAGGMAAGSILTFLFLAFSKKISAQKE